MKSIPEKTAKKLWKSGAKVFMIAKSRNLEVENLSECKIELLDYAQVSNPEDYWNSEVEYHGGKYLLLPDYKKGVKFYEGKIQ